MIGIFLLNLGPDLVNSDDNLVQPDGNFDQEKWFFINGVMVGSSWLRSAVNELSRLFGRRIIGIRNVTFNLSKVFSD